MPWKAIKPVDLKMEFIARLRSGERMTDLCREYGISRKTGHKLVKRVQGLGARGFSVAAWASAAFSSAGFAVACVLAAGALAWSSFLSMASSRARCASSCARCASADTKKSLSPDRLGVTDKDPTLGRAR